MEAFEIVPAYAGGWVPVAVALARKAERVMRPDRWHYLILEACIPGAPFVQLAVHDGLVLAEVRADQFARTGPLLDERVAEVMVASGWHEPVADRHSDRCNWWQEWPFPCDTGAICEHLVALLVSGFDLADHVVVKLSVFPGDDLSKDELSA
jgi:hypothetical protein